MIGGVLGNTVGHSTGGKSLLTWTQDDVLLGEAASALGTAARRGPLGKMTIERTDGEPLLTSRSSVTAALEAAGFIATPRGLRIRA